MKKKKDYFKTKDIRLRLSECDLDILMYAFYNIDWSGYDADDFGGEGDSAACVHLDEIEYQLNSEWERVNNKG